MNFVCFFVREHAQQSNTASQGEELEVLMLTEKQPIHLRLQKVQKNVRWIYFCPHEKTEMEKMKYSWRKNPCNTVLTTIAI